MTWEERQKLEYEKRNRIETDVECPECGKYLFRRIDIVLTTYPPKYQYECDHCGWKGTGA